MTLRMIAGIVTPDSGRIVLNGRVLFDSAPVRTCPPRAEEIGVVFQDYALFPHKTVAENVGFGLSDLPRSERQGTRSIHSLSACALPNWPDRYPSEISGGQRQRYGHCAVPGH
jgi:ABC-type sulfate/molybdate transport systems ATPase subunit